MKTQSQNGKNSVVAISSEHSIIIAIRWDESETKDLLGFAIRKENSDRQVFWVEGMLAFEGQEHKNGEPIASNVAPIQKMYWSDYKVRTGEQHKYEIIPVYGKPDNLSLNTDASISVSIKTESNAGQNNQVYFNRAVIASQAYVRNFDLASPNSDPRILSWLARGLDKAILNYIGMAIDNKDYCIDVAAYHLDHPEIIKAISRVGNRARVSLCWKKEDDIKRNQNAADKLKGAGVKVYKRENVGAISHSKFIILKNKNGDALKVLTGSTNFTTGGVSLQNNVSHIIDNPQLADFYLKTFELQISEDNDGLREQNGSWNGNPDGIEVNFSPHKRGERTDLNRFIKLVNAAKSSVFFATFRATDENLLKALTSPKNKDLVVRGLVDKVYEKGAGEVELYHKAFEKNPAVIPASNISSNIDPLRRELARQGFSPFVHHKFILIDYNTPGSVLITGSANYSKNSTEKNDENTLIIHNDQRAAEMYLAEFFRLYEHYRSRWFLSRSRTQSNELYLKDNDSWTKKYYGNTKQAKFIEILK